MPSPVPEKVFLPLPQPLIPVTSFRSTWLRSSLDLLREQNLLQPYLALLERDVREQILATIAGSWLPIAIAEAHYDACTKLEMPVEQQMAMGAAVTVRAQRTSMLFGLRLARQVGVTPWTAFAQQQRMWQHVWHGGGVGIWQLGPKEARLVIQGWPCARFSYCRIAMRGLLRGQSELFCAKAYVVLLSRLCTNTSLAYRVAWA